MVEALMSDIAADVIGRYDFSSDKQIAGALKRVRALSDELIRAIAQFRYDSARRRQVHQLRRNNTEGKLTVAQNDLFSALVDQNEDFAIVKAIALLEARRRGLNIQQHLPKFAPSVFSK